MPALIIRLGEEEWHSCLEHGEFVPFMNEYLANGRAAIIVPKGTDISVEEVAVEESKVHIIRNSTGECLDNPN